MLGDSVVGMIFQATKLLLNLWSLAMHLLREAKNNSALVKLQLYLEV